MNRCYLPVLFLHFFMLACCPFALAQNGTDSLLPVRGLAIAAPTPRNLDSFVTFMHNELAPRRVNTLILRVDFNYQFRSHPELVGNDPLSTADVSKLVNAAKRSGIRIVPQINLLGHQSWANTTGKLLAVYPEFDETPWVQVPEKYAWPNKDGLYCKSYCPLHPRVHQVVFDLVDEICTAFEATAFHAGMDEVFYIGEDACPRCGGRDKAELFAGEIRKIRDHLTAAGRELWIWGDRLLDGKTTGMGMWEASMNNTHRAIDLIPKDVVICDWHYERPDKSAVYFAMKGFRVITCPWRRPEVAVQQVNDMYAFRRQSTKEQRERYLGVMETIWTSVSSFLQEYYGRSPVVQKTDSAEPRFSQANTFKAIFEQIEKLEK